MNNDLQEYKIQKKIGDIDKAYYHLLRDFILNHGNNDISAETYYSHFKALGKGIPEFDAFKQFDK